MSDVGSSMELGSEVPRLLGWGSRGDKRRRLGRQVDPLQIAPDRYGLGQRGDEAQASAAGGADGNIESEDPCQ